MAMRLKVCDLIYCFLKMIYNNIYILYTFKVVDLKDAIYAGSTG